MSGSAKKKSQAEAISALLEAILADKGIDNKLQKYRAWTIWQEVVGPQIARQTQPLRIRESTLEVRVGNATWMQQLQLLKPKILAELNKQLGKNTLDDIYWKRGKIEQNNDSTDLHQADKKELIPLTEEDQTRIDEVTADLSDPELKQRLTHLLSLSHQHGDSDSDD